MVKRDYYDVLGVSRSATPEEIRRAHRRLVRQFHPDVNKGNPNAEEKFKEVQEAYDVLSDPQKRRNYDQFGHAGVGVQPGPGAYGAGVDPFEAFRRSQQGRGRGEPTWQDGVEVTFDGFEGAGGFGDLFEQLFGARRGRRRGGVREPSAPPPSGDIEHAVTISFEDAARGTKIPLQVSRDGEIETIEVKIPAGVKDGSRIRLRGRGQRINGVAGDIYIVCRVAPHPYFRREDLDVYLDLPISLYEAMLGTRVEVPTLEGPVMLNIPPGTSGGSKLRIRGRGIHRGTEKGDQYVIPRIIVPRDLDEQDRKLIAELQRKHPINARADVRW